MAQILINSRLCAEGKRPICQDTGIVTVFIKIGMNVQWEANSSVADMISGRRCGVRAMAWVGVVDQASGDGEGAGEGGAEGGVGAGAGAGAGAPELNTDDIAVRTPKLLKS